MPMPDLALPFFAYGSFKPGELAFSQIEPYLDGVPLTALAQGSLKVRDGLPLFLDAEGAESRGYLLRFRTDSWEVAYGIICGFEPSKHYEWKDRTLVAPAVRANILIGKKPGRGGARDLEGTSWSFRLDPVFRYGLCAVREIASRDAEAPFESAPPDAFAWPRFFQLQMAYLLLWSAIERFTAFAYGPALGPVARVDRLGEDQRFAASLRRCVPERGGSVTDTRDPGKKYTLDPTKPGSSADYYYQVRSNLSHRGKAAFRDGEIVRKSLKELLAIFEDMLAGVEGYAE
jgi:hypothetical protein